MRKEYESTLDQFLENVVVIDKQLCPVYCNKSLRVHMEQF